MTHQPDQGFAAAQPKAVAWGRRVHWRPARWWMLATGVVAVVVGLSACTAQGPRRLPEDRFNYNAAVADSANEQMLLNLVRLHHGEVPTFLAVSSVITQYVWSGDVGVAGASGDSLGFPAWTVGGSANVRYFERPTITYAPLSGQEFASQLISPVRADVVFSLVSSGWPPDQLLSMAMQRINDVENVSFSPPYGKTRERTTHFARVVELIVALSERDSVELVRGVGPDTGELFLDFPEAPSADAADLLRQFKDLIGLDQARSRFRITRRIVGRKPDEVTIRMHSLLELMGLLSKGVEAQVVAGSAESQLPEKLAPLKVRRHQNRPADAFVAVRYGGTWFDLAASDEESKRAFSLLIYLFQMQASQSPGAGPLITVPVG